MRYSHTTIDFAEWPNDPMFSDLEGSNHLQATIHLRNVDPMRTIDMELTVG